MEEYSLKTNTDLGHMTQSVKATCKDGIIKWKVSGEGEKIGGNDKNPMEVALNEILKSTITMTKIHLEKNKIDNVLPIIYLVKKKKINEIDKLTKELSISKEFFVNSLLNEAFESSYDHNLQESILKISIAKKIPVEKVADYLDENKTSILKEIFKK